jgi:hypothetical protein
MREKAAMVQMLQQLALARGVRVTFISGDVHVAGVGRFMSSPKRSLRADHRWAECIGDALIAVFDASIGGDAATAGGF